MYDAHTNFYENESLDRVIGRAIEDAEEIVLPVLERLQDAPPRPFTTDSNTQLRRLVMLTGDDTLQRHQSSEVGFLSDTTPAKRTEAVARATTPILIGLLAQPDRPASLLEAPRERAHR